MVLKATTSNLRGIPHLKSRWKMPKSQYMWKVHIISTFFSESVGTVLRFPLQFVGQDMYCWVNNMFFVSLECSAHNFDIAFIGSFLSAHIFMKLMPYINEISRSAERHKQITLSFDCSFLSTDTGLFLNQFNDHSLSFCSLCGFR